MPLQNPQPGYVQNPHTGEIGNNKFGGGSAESHLGPAVLVLLLLILVLILVGRRKFILGPVMFGLFLLPVGQTLVLAGFHLYVFRIIVAVALARAFASRPSQTPLFGGGFNSFDKLFILWAVVRASAFVLRFREMGAVFNQVGETWDVLGGYFLMRFLIQDDDDVLRAVKVLSAIVALLSIPMLYEHLHGVNPFGLLTSTPIWTEIRRGTYRAKGPFHHEILAGTFAATLLPLFVWLWKSKKAEFLGLTGIVASAVTVFSAASSTPVSAFAGGILAICLWPMRRSMRTIRWGLVLGIVMLNFTMHAPVWYALEHIDFAGGSAGSHRSELIGNFVYHFGDWWLAGTSDNASWGYEMWDTSNQYVKEGETGGLATFICFVGLLYLGFKWIGMSRKAVAGNRQNEWYFWFLGATLFSHCVAFLGICYFDQTKFSWYVLLAVICVATAPFRRPALPTTERQSVQNVSMLAVQGDDAGL